MTQPIQHVGSCTGGNTIPLDDEGRTYHFGCKVGEVANEVLLVADYLLASEIAKNFEGTPFKRESNRGYTTYTGMYKGRKLSVVAIGIGFAMVDFLIRELRKVTEGPLTFFQLGSAPTASDLPLGSVVVSNDAVAAAVDFEGFEKESLPYRIYKKPVPAAPALVKSAEASLKSAGFEARTGRFCSNPSFSAGISAPSKASGGVGPFDFKADGLLDRIVAECGPISSLEMDTYPLLWTSLRAVAKDISSCAVSVVGSNLKGEFLPVQEIHEKLLKVAPVLLEALGQLSKK
jgi:uridine phosphorylase